MSPPQELADFARRVLQYEVERVEQPGGWTAGLQRVCQALHERLAPLISSAGFRTLFTRAIKLAARDFPFLATLHVHTNGGCTFIGVPGAGATRESRHLADALTAVLAHFMWLLVIFIGENLGLGKIREVWPEVPFDAVDSVSGAEE